MGFSMNMLMAFAGQTWAQLISFYLATRVIFALFCLLQAYYVPMIRAMMFSAVASVVIPLALWITSIYVELPRRFILIWIAMLLGGCTNPPTFTRTYPNDPGRFIWPNMDDLSPTRRSPSICKTPKHGMTDILNCIPQSTSNTKASGPNSSSP